MGILHKDAAILMLLNSLAGLDASTGARQSRQHFGDLTHLAMCPIFVVRYPWFGVDVEKELNIAFGNVDVPIHHHARVLTELEIEEIFKNTPPDKLLQTVEEMSEQQIDGVWFAETGFGFN